MKFTASLPPIQSAIKVDGGEKGAVRIQLDCYLEELNELARLRGKKLEVEIREINF